MWEIWVQSLDWEDPLEKGMATHSSGLSFPGGSDGKSVCLQCRRPRFDPWVTNIAWRRVWQPTPVFLPEECDGQRSLLLLLSRFSRVRLCATPETAAHQAPLSLGFSRQEHWSGLPFPSPMHESEKWKWSRWVMSDSSRSPGPQPTGLLRPWKFPGKSIGVGCHCLLPQRSLEGY